MTEGERREDGWLSELAALTRAATPERREDGWEELRREIEALHDDPIRFGSAKDASQNTARAVLAIVDRLAALPEPAIDVERLADRDVGQFEPNIDIRKLVVAWFHDSEEICEHDEPPWSCEIMADHLLAAFTVEVRDWKAYAADNRRSVPE